MITKIDALNYRSLRYVSQRLGRFHTLVGPNGSGKSTFLDCVAFIADMLRSGPVHAVQGNGDRPVRSMDPSHLVWMRSGSEFQLAVELAIPEARLQRVEGGKYATVRYEVAVSVGDESSSIGLTGENLWLLPASKSPESRRVPQLFPHPTSAPESIVLGERRNRPKGWKKVVGKIGSSGNDYFESETSDWRSPFRLGPAKSALANLPEDEERFPIATWVKRVLLEGVQRVQLNAEVLRRPSAPGLPRSFSPDGSNLPWVVEGLARDADRFSRWIAHLNTPLPDLAAVKTVERPEDRHRYLVLEYKNGLQAPSWVISDGTLRMLALTLLAYLPEQSQEGIYLVEEPENGIHPQAIETVFQSLSSVYGGQLLCASHSPIVLGLARLNQLLCFAKDESGATDIVTGDEHPRLRDWKGSIDLGTLFASGVLG